MAKTFTPKNWKDLKPHPVADILPLISPERWQEFLEGFRKIGYDPQYPIVLYEGKIVDGRNRHKGCIETGTEPVCIKWEPLTIDEGVADFVKRVNVDGRRQLTEGQRAAFAVDFDDYQAREDAKRRQRAAGTANLKQGDVLPVGLDRPRPVENGRSADQLAKKWGTNATAVKRTREAKEKAPDLHEKIKTGELSPWQAKQELKQRQPAISPKSDKEDNSSIQSEGSKKVILVCQTNKWTTLDGAGEMSTRQRFDINCCSSSAALALAQYFDENESITILTEWLSYMLPRALQTILNRLDIKATIYEETIDAIGYSNFEQ